VSPLADEAAETVRGEREADLAVTVVRFALGCGDELAISLLRIIGRDHDTPQLRAWCRRLQKHLQQTQ
jgi:hypothetical protein